MPGRQDDSHVWSRLFDLNDSCCVVNPQDTCIAFQLDANIGVVGSDSGMPFPDISKSVTCVGVQ